MFPVLIHSPSVCCLFSHWCLPLSKYLLLYLQKCTAFFYVYRLFMFRLVCVGLRDSLLVFWVFIIFWLYWKYRFFHINILGLSPSILIFETYYYFCSFIISLFLIHYLLLLFHYFLLLLLSLCPHFSQSNFNQVSFFDHMLGLFS